MPACYLFNGTTANTAVSGWADICPADLAESPPHIQIFISDQASVQIKGTVDPFNPDLALDYSNGGFTATTSRRLIQGIRFWSAVITGNTGRVTVAIGDVPMYGKGWKSVKLKSSTAGTPVP